MRLRSRPQPPHSSGERRVETKVERPRTQDQTIFFRVLGLWLLCSGMSSLTTNLILRNYFLVVWSFALLLLASWLVSTYWRPGETTQYVTIENWHTHPLPREEP